MPCQFAKPRVPTEPSRARSSCYKEGRYPDQLILVVAVEGYAYLVPYVEEPDGYFLKTVIPSRKATREYLSQGET